MSATHLLDLEGAVVCDASSLATTSDIDLVSCLDCLTLTRAGCCGITAVQSENDGFSLVRVGMVMVCGSCLVDAGVVEDAS